MDSWLRFSSCFQRGPLMMDGFKQIKCLRQGKFYFEKTSVLYYTTTTFPSYKIKWDL